MKDLNELLDKISKNQAIEYVKNHAKEFAIGATGLAFIAGIALLWSNFKKQQKKDKIQQNQNQNQTQRQPQSSQQQKDNFPIIQEEEMKTPDPTYMDQFKQFDIKSTRKLTTQEAAAMIQIQFDPALNSLSLQTIQQILEVGSLLAKEEYIKFTEQSRRERRLIFQKEQEKYERLVIEYNDQVEDILTKSGDQLLEALNLKPEVFEKSIHNLMSLGPQYIQEIWMLQNITRQNVKAYIPAKKQVTLQQQKEIMRFQIKLLEEKPEIFNSIIKKLFQSGQENQENIQLIPLAINIVLQDYIYDEFQIEEEDTMNSLKQSEILADEDFKIYLQQIQEAIQKLLLPYGEGMSM